jgi:methylated-DNA-[protein]-cysteine S-methyltransferase
VSTLRRTVVASRLGTLTLVASDAGLCGLHFDPDRWPAARGAPVTGEWVAPDEDVVLGSAVDQLERYLDGELRGFSLPIDLSTVTGFVRDVLEVLCDVTYGSVTTYGALANELGTHGAARAVGGACNRNPIPIVVPCHRVIAADGSLGGYALGTEVKRTLLGIERGVAVPPGGWEPAALRRATVAYVPDEDALTLF